MNKGNTSRNLSRENYTVSIKGFPTDSNNDAEFKPHETRLELKCAGNTRSLVNIQFPVEETFEWMPGSCDDVILQIKAGDISLMKRYEGTHGFIKFLQDFSGGTRTFYPQEFPGKESALERMRIKYIKVNYQFIGSQELVTWYHSIPEQLPGSITKCWNQ